MPVSFDEFYDIIKSDPDTAHLNYDDLAPIYDQAYPNVRVSAEPDTTGDDSWEITKGFKQSVDTTQATGYGVIGLIGDAIDSDTIREFGLEGYKRNIEEGGENTPRIHDYEQIRTDSFGNWVEDASDYVLGGVGQLGPTALTMIGTGGFGGMIGKKIAEKSVKKFLETRGKDALQKGSVEKLTSQVIKRAKQKGQALGAYGASSGMETGEIYGSVAEEGAEGADAILPSLAGGFTAGAMDALPIMHVAKKFGFGGDLKSDLVKSMKRRVGEGIATQMPLEFGTEAFQTYIEEFTKAYIMKRDLPEDIGHQMLNAGFIGSFGGGVMGGVGGLATPNVPQKQEKIDTSKDTILSQKLRLKQAHKEWLDRKKIAKVEVIDQHSEDPIFDKKGIDEVITGQSDFTLADDERLKQGLNDSPDWFQGEDGKWTRVGRELEPTVIPMGRDGGKDLEPTVIAGRDENVLPPTVYEAPLEGELLGEQTALGQEVPSIGKGVIEGETFEPKSLPPSEKIKALEYDDTTEADALVEGERLQVAKDEREKLTKVHSNMPVAGLSKEDASNIIDQVGFGRDTGQAGWNEGFTYDRLQKLKSKVLKDSKIVRYGSEEIATLQRIANYNNNVPEPDGYTDIKDIPSHFPFDTQEEYDNWRGEKRGGDFDTFMDKGEETFTSKRDASRDERNKRETFITEASKAAALSPENNLPEPTDAQKEAGNYKKAHVTLDGMNVSIENPKGSTRKGVDGEGKEWSSEMKDHYGYIKGTVGYDKDHVDTFIGENPGANDVFVVNQINPKTGRFDEHKVMQGYNSQEEALDAYNRNYDKGWKGAKNIVTLGKNDFKSWVYSDGPKKGELKTDDQLTLDTQTEASIKADEKQAADNVKAEQQVQKKQESDATVDEFSLTDDMGTDPNQEDLFSQGVPKPAKLKVAEEAIDKKIDDVAAKLAAKFLASRGTLNSGVDPEILLLGAELGALYIGKGAVKFAQYSQSIINKLKEFGIKEDEIKPALKQMYAASQMTVTDEQLDLMDDAKTVRAFDLNKLEETNNVSTVSNKTITDDLVKLITEDNAPINLTQLRKYIVEKGFDGKDEMEVKRFQELYETAQVKVSQNIINKGDNQKDTFMELVGKYIDQPVLHAATSTSVMNQAFSTPAPLAYMAARLANINKSHTVYEPTAGNGMLLITADKNKATVNELEELRNDNLKYLGFETTNNDATEYVPGKEHDRIIMNPPFGNLGKGNSQKVDGYVFREIDQLIAVKALSAMKYDGMSTIIIGANKNKGTRSSNDQIFFNWLYSNYNVTSHFEADGKLYARQGASWPVAVITVKGKNNTNKAVSPTKADEIKRLDTWGKVYEHSNEMVDSTKRKGLDFSDTPSGRNLNSSQVTKSDGVSGITSDKNSASSGQGNRGTTTGIDGSTTKSDGDLSSGNITTGSTNRLDEGKNQVTGGYSGSIDTPESNDNSRANRRLGNVNQLQQPYKSFSDGYNEDMYIPTGLQEATELALENFTKRNGPVDDYVMSELQYGSKDSLYKSLMGSQVDVVALAIDNIKRGSAMINGSQTGVGKGRTAAAIIRWSILNNKMPIFVTEKDKLFSDMYEDLMDIDTDYVHPFIMNKDGVIKHNGTTKFYNKGHGSDETHGEAISSGVLPEGRNAIFMTYSQINTPNNKRSLLSKYAGKDSVIILDEAHNASGIDSNTGKFIQSILNKVGGAYYLSATYAKRPDNMPLYFNTDLKKATDSKETLVSSIEAGGVLMQTVISEQLARSGQLFRTERTFKGIKINEVTVGKDSKLETKQQEELADNFTRTLRSITGADTHFHHIFVKNLAKAVGDGKHAVYIPGTEIDSLNIQSVAESVDHTNFTSVVHNKIKQMLFSAKVDAAADLAIQSLKDGKKPVIAVDDTMETFLNRYVAENGNISNLTFKDVLHESLENSRRLRVKVPTGDKPISVLIPLNELDDATRVKYEQSTHIINQLDTENLPVSPIDWIRHRIEEAGYTVKELTGRSKGIDYSNNTIYNINDGNRTDIVNEFNGGKKGDTVSTKSVDVVILNRAGSTGLSMHSSEKFVNQQQREMIVAQPSLDINVFMQMLGRINRTGQVNKPIFDILALNIPAEKRPNAILSSKMKSLNAQTSSDTKSSTSVKSMDIMNKYGDEVVADYIAENRSYSTDMNVDSSDADLVKKVTGRLSVLPVSHQKSFYDDIESIYNDYISELTKMGRNDLEKTIVDLSAKLINTDILYPGKHKGEIFGGDALIGEYEVDKQGFPMTSSEVVDEINKFTKSTNVSDTITKLKEYGEVYKKSITNDPEGNKLRAYNLSENEAINTLDKFSLSDIVNLEVDKENMKGVVVSIRATAKDGKSNPFALSKIKIRFAVDNSYRTLVLPLSKLDSAYSSHDYRSNFKDIFDKPDNKKMRETRTIVTGNVLQGMSSAPGNIIQFTNDDNTTSIGIMLPANYKHDLSKDMLPVHSVDDALSHLKNDVEIKLPLDNSSIKINSDGGLSIVAGKSKAKAKSIITDELILSKIVSNNFTKVGGGLWRGTTTPNNTNDVLGRLMEIMPFKISRSVMDGDVSTEPVKKQAENITGKGASVVEDENTKTGEVMWLAELPRVEKEEFGKLKSQAKKHGGYYNRFKRKFHFKDGGKEGAQKFVDEFNSDSESGVKFSKESVTAFADKLESKFNLKNLHLYMSGDDLKLNVLIVDKDDRNQGVGSKVVEEITQYADNNNLRVLLSPAVQDDFQGTTSRSRLVKFYKRLGFKENKGRNKDFTISESMFRDPKNSPQKTITSKQTIEQLRKNLGKISDKVKLVQKQSELPLTAEENKGIINGMYDPETGDMWLVADNISEGDSKNILNHEAVHGMLKHTDAYQDALTALEKEKGKPAYKKAEQAVKDADTKPENVQEEILSYYIQNHPKMMFVQRLIAKIRSIVRKYFGGEMNISDVQAMVADMATGNVKGEYVLNDGRVMFSKSGKVKQTDSANFKKWFGDSKVVDEDGEPLVMYHGSPTDYEEGFLDGSPNFFTPSTDYANVYADKNYKQNGPNVKPVYIRSEKPFDTRNAEAKKIFDTQYYRKYGSGAPLNDVTGLPDWNDAEDLVEFIQEQGLDYDSVLIDEGVSLTKEGKISTVVWGANQIKSAVGNSGAFSTTDNRIQFSKSTPEARNTKWETDPGMQGLDTDTFSALSKTGKPPTSTVEDFKEKAHEFKYRWATKLKQWSLDQYVSFKDILNDPKSYMLATLSGTSHGAIEKLITTGQVILDASGALSLDVNKKSLAQALHPLKEETDRFLNWVAGNRAAQLNKDSEAAATEAARLINQAKALEKQAQADIVGNITVSGRTDINAMKREAKALRAEAKVFAKKAEVKERLFTEEDIKNLQALNKNSTDNGTLGNDREKIYAQALKDLNEVQQSVTQIGVDTGLINKEQAEIWNAQSFYIPFNRLIDESETKGKNFVSGLTSQNAYEKLKGADIQLDDLLSNVLMNFNHIIDASLKNQAAVSALKTSEKLGLATEVKQHEAGKNSVFVKVDGKETYYNINNSQDGALVRESLVSMNYDGLNSASMKVMRKFKRALTMGVTASPEFKVANLMRDSLQALAATDVDVNLFKNLKQGWLASNKGNPVISIMEASGAAFPSSGYIHGSDPEMIRESLRKGIEDSHILDNRNKIKKMWDSYQDFGSRLENVNRAANFEQNLKSGMSLLEASYNARDHLDFNRTGSAVAIRAIAQTVPFFNARLQGMYKLGRAVSDPKQRGQFMAVVGTYTLASIALYLMMKDDEDYKEAKDWERDTYHLFKLPGSDIMYRFPRPFEMGAIASMTERAVEQMVNDEVHGKLFGERLLHAVMETFALNPTPQLFKPMVEVWANKDSFRDTPIESMSMKNLSPTERRKLWTSETAIGASKVMDSILWEDVVLSPVQIDHLINGYLGWMGGFVTQSTDMLVQPAIGRASKPSKRIEDYPIIGRFAREGKVRSSKYIDSFYDNVQEINTIYADIKLYRENKDYEAATKKISDNIDKLRYRKFLNKQRGMISKINTQIRLISKDKNLSPEAKSRRTKVLYERRNAIARRAVARIS